jgi:hypothetical protein
MSPLQPEAPADCRKCRLLLCACRFWAMLEQACQGQSPLANAAESYPACPYWQQIAAETTPAESAVEPRS